MFGRKALAVIAALALGLGVLGTGSPTVWAVAVGAFSVEGNTADYEYKNNVLTVKNGAVLTVSMPDGAAATKDRIEVPEGEATITISNLNIDRPKEGSPISVLAGASLDLKLAGTNKVLGEVDQAGVEVASGSQKNATLRVSAATNNSSGKLIAESFDGGAGIGGSYYSGIRGGTVVVDSGEVVAIGKNGSGIGAGPGNAFGGAVTVNGGVVTATSRGGAGIGGGNEGNGGVVTVNGGTVTATSRFGAGIGGGNYRDGGNLTVNGGTVTATSVYGTGIGGGRAGAVSDTAGGAVIVNGGTVAATGGQGVADIGGAGKAASGGSLRIQRGSGGIPRVELTSNGTDADVQSLKDAVVFGAGAVKQGTAGVDGFYDKDGKRSGYVAIDDPGSSGTGWSRTDNVVTLTGREAISDSYLVDQKNPDAAAPNRLVVKEGLAATVSLSGVNIKEPKGGAPISVSVGASLDLRLVGTSTVSGGSGFAGVHVPKGSPDAALRISATAGDGLDKLIAKGTHGGAGIGGNSSDGPGRESGGDAGTITVEGGVVEASTANTPPFGSGIGGGFDRDGGVVTINGGKVTATGATGIGGGAHGAGGSVEINGGEVEATGEYGPGIGAGGDRDAAGVVMVNGGSVTAIGNEGGAGIGGSAGKPGGAGAEVFVHGGVVTAISNDRNGFVGGAGIGGGGSWDRFGGVGGSVSIDGGVVSATGGMGGADIGGGVGSSDGGSLKVVADDPKSVPVVKLTKNGTDVTSPVFQSAVISDEGAGAVGQGIDGVYDADGDRNPGEYSVEQVGGIDGSADTTELKVKFGRKMMTGLDKAKFTVDGAKAELKDPDSEFKEFTLELPKPFKNGSKVSVKPVWNGWKFTPASVEMQVFAQNPVITDPGVLTATVFEPFEVQLSGSTRGKASWSLSEGPEGMKTDSTGKVTWQPSVVPNTYSFKVKVEDSYGSAEKQLSVRVGKAPGVRVVGSLITTLNTQGLQVDTSSVGVDSNQSIELAYSLAADGEIGPVKGWVEPENRVVTFTGLKPLLEYYVWIRSAENEFYTAGAASKTALMVLPDPIFEDVVVPTAADRAASAEQLGADVLPTTGSVAGFGYTINWGDTTLDRTRGGSGAEFTGALVWDELPGGIVASVGRSVSRKVSVAIPDIPQSAWPGDSAYVQGSGVPLVWRVEKDLDMAAEVFMDDTELAQGSAYLLTSGSTVVSLLPEFLDAQNVGSHVLKVSFVDGTSAETQFQIKVVAKDATETEVPVVVDTKKTSFPPTGAPGIPAWPIGAFALIMLSAGVVLVKRIFRTTCTGLGVRG